MITAIIALMLQENPTLTQNKIEYGEIALTYKIPLEYEGSPTFLGQKQLQLVLKQCLMFMCVTMVLYKTIELV